MHVSLYQNALITNKSIWLNYVISKAQMEKQLLQIGLEYELPYVQNE